MCGIYGIFSRVKNGLLHKDFEIFQKMGIITQLRGSDSSGVFAIPYKERAAPKILKVVGPSCFLEYNKDFEEWCSSALKGASGIVGHGRAATKGKISKENAHPFRSKPFTLVHNGTIMSGLDHHNVDVDSQALCMEIQQKGVIDALHGISGAYAIIVYDEENNKTYLARNTERPLHILSVYDRHYVMSEYEALYFLARRDKLVLNGEPDIKYLEPHKVYIIDGEGAFYKEGEVPPKKTYYCQTPSHHSYPNFHSGHQYSSPSNNAQPTNIEIPKYKKGDQIEFTVSGVTGPNNGIYTYIGRDEDNNHISFFTPGMDPTLLDRYGVGRCVSVTWNKGSYTYQVKARAIKWDKDDTFVTTYDDEAIEKKVWEKLCESQDCHGCNTPISSLDNEKTLIVKENDGSFALYCHQCINGAHTDGIQGADIKRLMS